MRINTNVSAINAYNNLSKVQDSLSSSMEKLSSGFRINKAGDDAAGLGIANQLRGDIGAMQQASNNADQSMSVLQIMDGATQNIETILDRMKELAAESASDTVDSTARTKINNEFSSLSDEVDRIVNTTKFQGANLLDGTYGSKTVQAGTVDATSNFVAGSQIASVVPTNGTLFQGLTGNVTATVATVNTSGALSGGTATVSDQTTLNGLTGNVSVGVTQSAATLTAGTLDNTVVTGLAEGTGTTDPATVRALAAGTYHLSVTADTTAHTASFQLLDSSNANVGTAVTVAANATSATVNGIAFTIATGQDETDMAGLDGQNFTVAQNYNVALSGGGASTETQAYVDDGSANFSHTFANFGLTIGFNHGAESGVGNAVSVTGATSLTLSGHDATNNAITQSLAVGTTPASAALNFTSFGLTVNLKSTATNANVLSSVDSTHNTIVHAQAHQAQYLVSASQSYSGNDLISLDAVSLSAKSIGVDKTSIDLTTATGAQAALTSIDGAITQVGNALGAIGAAENRITYASANVKTSIENFSAAESTIRDVDMAQEMTTFSKNQILAQAGTAMLAQANQMGASVLKLLQ
ncbi:MAG TPA: flagellin [Gemmatimonadaceae bacterium]